MAEPVSSARQTGVVEPAGDAAPKPGKGRAGSPSPMMVQYLAIKAGYPDALLFYRMGDFYEMFFEDAVTAAAALDIVLTKRGKHEGADIAMCGVPVHAAETYSSRLIRQGFRVAVCEQVEDPAEAKKRGSKAVVRRQVVRLVTAGTLTEDALLEARENNFLCALARAGGELALAWLDISTGEFRVGATDGDGLAAELARLAPGELLVPEGLTTEPAFFDLFAEWKQALTVVAPTEFESGAAERRLKELYGVASLDAFGAFSRPELAALGAVIGYAEVTQKGQLPHIKPPHRVAAGASLLIDAATRRNLELTRSLAGERRGSLLHAVDRTVTSGGGRLIAAWLGAPLTDAAAVNRRLDAVAYFHDQPEIAEAVSGALKQCPDIERAVSRLTIGRGGPRDLAAVREGLSRAGTLRAGLEGAAGAVLVAGSDLAPPPPEIESVAAGLGHHAELVDRLERALAPDLPVLTRDGGFIAAGYHAALDEQRSLRDESRRLVAALEQRYRNDTGIAGLKIRHNNVLGYHIDVTAKHGDTLLGDDAFIHRQTLVNSMRFSTVELGDLAAAVARAGDRALALELELFEDLLGEVRGRVAEIMTAAESLAGLDVFSGLGTLARERNFCRPVVDDSLAFTVVAGRHPVVEAALETTGEARFIANDCDLGGGGEEPQANAGRRLWLLTGPNMAGKSTFLRQNALIAILAQSGSFTPAESAHIGVVDRLFSRVGAADDLARGRSTFMVEMIETAAILNQASERSLVILDEIGRGTATYDGLSIAWATVEHLHDETRCRALFATHYHELTALGPKLAQLGNFNMRVREWRGDVVFLHEVAPGAADRSYGIHVGRLAGLPQSVVARAEQVLGTLEEAGGPTDRLAEDLPLFTATPPPPAREPQVPDLLADAVAGVNPDELTPKQALEFIYRFKELARDRK